MPGFTFRIDGRKDPRRIVLIYRNAGRQYTYPTGEHVPAAFWQGEKGKKLYQRCIITSKHVASYNINRRLDNIMHAAIEAHRELQRQGAVEWTELKRCIDIALGKTQPITDIWQWAQVWVDRIKNTTSTRSSNPTYNSYRQTIRILRGFEKHTRYAVTFNSINPEMHRMLVEYMQKDLHFKINTCGRHIKNIKALCNAAQREGITMAAGWMHKDFKTMHEITPQVVVSIQELDKLALADLPEVLDVYRDWFIIQCYTGLRVGDLFRLNAESIKDDYLHITQGKTGTPVLIPMHTHVHAVVAKYNGWPPKRSEQKYNLYIKQACLLAGIDAAKCGQISSHTARRSFATNLYLSGFPAHDIMKITGHATEAAFMRYLRITQVDSAHRLRQFWQLDKFADLTAH